MKKTKKKVDKKEIAKLVGYAALAIGGIAGLCYSIRTMSKWGVKMSDLLPGMTADEAVNKYLPELDNMVVIEHMGIKNVLEHADSVYKDNKFIYTRVFDEGLKPNEFAKVGDMLTANDEFSEFVDTFTHFIAIGKTKET